jgi:hypothetical protein
VILALRKLRQEDCKFKAVVGYVVRPCLNNNNNKKQTKRQNKSVDLRCCGRGEVWTDRSQG